MKQSPVKMYDENGKEYLSFYESDTGMKHIDLTLKGGSIVSISMFEGAIHVTFMPRNTCHVSRMMLTEYGDNDARLTVE
jgi:hypothetical protein